MTGDWGVVLAGALGSIGEALVARNNDNNQGRRDYCYDDDDDEEEQEGDSVRSPMRRTKSGGGRKSKMHFPRGPPETDM